MNLKRLISFAAAAVLTLSCAGAFSEAVTPDDDADKIRSVQSELAVLQLLTDEQVNGIWDETTLEAMMRFQRFVNNVQGEGTLVESGECDADSAGFLEFAAGKGWNVAEQVSADDVWTPAELEAKAAEEAAAAEAAAAAAEEAERQKLENDKATIAYVQSMLRQLGLLEEVTGEYDEATKAAILRAQQFINQTAGSDVVPLNGAYDDSETLIYLNKAAEENWEIPLTAETPEPVVENTDPAAQPVVTHEPKEGVAQIKDFILTIDGEQKSETVQIAAGQHSIAWSGEGVAMFSMYLYDENGTLLNKSENMPVNYFTLDTFGMSSGAVYEIRVGAVPNGGQVADMEWRSLFLTLG